MHEKTEASFRQNCQIDQRLFHGPSIFHASPSSLFLSHVWCYSGNTITSPLLLFLVFPYSTKERRRSISVCTQKYIHTETHRHMHTQTHTHAHTHIYTNTYHLIPASTLSTPHSRPHTLVTIILLEERRERFLLVKVRAPSFGDPPGERKESRRREPGRGESELHSISWLHPSLTTQSPV